MTTLAFPPAAPGRALAPASAPAQATAPARQPRPVPVTLLAGDGIGPEVSRAVRRVLDAAGARLEWEDVPGGLDAPGTATGLPRETLLSIERTGVLLKGPLVTPAGAGRRSANATLRKLFETYANVRPARELPGIHTPFTGRGVDLVVVRENVEDLQAGIEHQQTPTVAQALKLVTREGCERVARFACELAEDEGRRTVTCATRSDVLALTEGMMQRVFEEVAAEHSGLRAEHLLADDVAHQLVRRPEAFDVIVTTSMNGDILADLAAGLVGGLGVAPSANVGRDVAIFEAVHGAAPDLAGRDLANPTALLRSAVLLLRYVGDLECAERVERALLAALGDGVRTLDLGDGPGWVGTAAFAEAVIARLDRAPHSEERAPARQGRYARLQPVVDAPRARRAQLARETTVGIDVFVQSEWAPAALGAALEGMASDGPCRLLLISNRGTQVYPDVGGSPSLADHYRCRFVTRTGGALADADLLALVERVGRAFRWVHLERLRTFDGVPAFTQVPGQA